MRPPNSHDNLKTALFSRPHEKLRRFLPTHGQLLSLTAAKVFEREHPGQRLQGHRARAATPESVGGRQYTHKPLEPAPTPREIKAYFADQTQKTEQFETEMD